MLKNENKNKIVNVITKMIKWAKNVFKIIVIDFIVI
jgi:hypothetical protein